MAEKRYLEAGLTKLVRARPVIIITTRHENGVVNAGTFGAYTNLSPSEIGIAIGTSSHTYRNLRRTGECVLNVVTRSLARAAEVCGEDIPETESELEKAGLTTEPARKIGVRLIKECVVNVECRYLKEVEIGHHSFVIVTCLAGHIEENAIDTDGGLDVVKAEAAFNIGYPRPIYAVLAKPFLAE